MAYDLSTKKILVITGKAGAGKDTLAQMVREEIYGSDNNSLRGFKFSAPLKDAFCDIFGWNRGLIDSLEYKQARLGTPFVTQGDEELWTRREIMQYLGTDVFRKGDPDVWIKAALSQAANAMPFVDGYVCTDCRFPNELKALRDNFGSVYTLDLVKIGGDQLSGKSSAHESEQGPYGDEEKAFASLLAGDINGLRAVAFDLAHRVFPEAFKEIPHSN